MPAAKNPSAAIARKPGDGARGRLIGRPFRGEPRHAPELCFILGAELATRVAQYCQLNGERPRDFVEDAIALWLDELEGPIDV